MIIPDIGLYIGELDLQTKEKKLSREQNAQQAKDSFDDWRELLACCWFIKKIRNSGGYYYDKSIVKEDIDHAREVFSTLSMGYERFPFPSSLDDAVCMFYPHSRNLIDRAFYDDAFDEREVLDSVQSYIDFFEYVIKIWRYAASQMGPGATLVLDINSLMNASEYQFCPDIIADVGKALRVDTYIEALSRGVPVADICRGKIKADET